MLANFVQETANAPGMAATINLGGAVAGRVGFAAAYPSGATCFYGLDDGTQGEWGIGTVTHGSPVTLTRTTVLGSTASSTARLNFTGITRVYATLPAERAIWRDASNNVSLPGATLAVAPAGNGQVHLNAGTATNPGYVGFFSADGTRRGYIGSGDGTNHLLLTGENGWAWKVTSAALHGTTKLVGTLLLPETFGTNSIQAGTGDGATYATHNIRVKGWWGWGFADHTDTVRGYYDFRTGTWDVLGGFRINGLLAGAAPNRQVFTASGTWTKPTGYPADTPVLVECWGGGGGGSTWQAWSGGGGGGAYNQRFMRLGDLGATETVTVGSGGGVGTNGGTGGTSPLAHASAPLAVAVVRKEAVAVAAASTAPATAMPEVDRPRSAPMTTTSVALKVDRPTPTITAATPPILAGPAMAAAAAVGTTAPAAARSGAAAEAAAAARRAAHPRMAAMAAPVEATTRQRPAGAAAALNQGRAAKFA